MTEKTVRKETVLDRVKAAEAATPAPAKPAPKAKGKGKADEKPAE